ncbi:NAD(P)H-binding protein [Paenibacillus sepulcri]|uniref:NAD(P)H-binding protein n=1 Tax=Paenibacillus sepulcri TaxID=359917 RepID=A0ABS7CDZ4_9BACL|nr:NAD(P)H-binding protein [Paenibacillus sepulcri]
MKKAIIFGATGFVGSYLLDELLNNADYEQVTAVVRRNLNINHPKLKRLIGDYYSLPGLKEHMEADEIFITLGETHDYPVLAAQIAKEKGARSVFVVTAVGANVNSRISYVKTKGEIERDIRELDFDHTHFFRPSMIMGERKENRPLERIIMRIWTIIDPFFFGKLNHYKGTEGKNIANAMNNAAKNQLEKVKVYNWRNMKYLL